MNNDIYNNKGMDDDYDGIFHVQGARETTAAVGSEDWWLSRMYLLYVACVRVLVVLLMVAFMVMLVLWIYYSGSAVDSSREAHHQRNVHLEQVQTAIERTSGSGLPWYEIMDVPPECLVLEILRFDVKHGLRPAETY